MSTISSGTTLTTALVQTGDLTGNLVIKTGNASTTAVTISGTNQSVSLAAPLPVTSGGTGATTQSAAANAVLPSQTSNNGKYLTTDGANASWATVTQTRISGGTTGLTPNTLTSGDVTLAGTLAVANGGTGATSLSSITVGAAVNLSTNRTNWSTNGTLTAVVGQLAWKNYSNNHTIFDASAGTSPDGTAINNTNSQSVWTGTYPTLMGWNGSTTYGVRVDSARVADSASSAAGVAKAWAQFTPSSGAIAGSKNVSSISTGNPWRVNWSSGFANGNYAVTVGNGEMSGDSFARPAFIQVIAAGYVQFSTPQNYPLVQCVSAFND